MLHRFSYCIQSPPKNMKANNFSCWWTTVHTCRRCFHSLSIDSGFTLIELLVVVIILGTLSTMALPTLFAQVGRAREAEGKQILSAIGFAQQGYFFENGVFATDYNTLGVTFQSRHYNIGNPVSTGSVVSKVQAEAIDAVNKNARNFGMGVYFEGLTYEVILCRSETPATQTVAPDDPTGDCSNNGTNEK